MIIQTWADVLTQSFQNLWIGLIAFVPNILVAIIIFIFGWLVGAALGSIVSQVLKTVKLDAALKQTGLNDVVERAGFTLDSGAFLGALVKWFFIIVFLMASLEVLGLTQVNMFLQMVVLSYLPQVIVAVIMVLVGALLAELAKTMVGGAAKAAGIMSAGLAGSIAKWAIWIFTILAVLAQLQVATVFVQTLVTGVVIAVSLAVGLAFGLGGQDAAARAIEKVRSEIGNHKH
ncbi:hypothetical protein EPO56_01950 [Patescibacteria group bacterium]|nr:MAG: hypothetical protein EPO56_01950 [Patescibacteria group bacterium]